MRKVPIAPQGWRQTNALMRSYSTPNYEIDIICLSFHESIENSIDATHGRNMLLASTLEHSGPLRGERGSWNSMRLSKFMSISEKARASSLLHFLAQDLLFSSVGTKSLKMKLGNSWELSRPTELRRKDKEKGEKRKFSDTSIMAWKSMGRRRRIKRPFSFQRLEDFCFYFSFGFHSSICLCSCFIRRLWVLKRALLWGSRVKGNKATHQGSVAMPSLVLFQKIIWGIEQRVVKEYYIIFSQATASSINRILTWFFPWKQYICLFKARHFGGSSLLETWGHNYYNVHH